MEAKITGENGRYETRRHPCTIQLGNQRLLQLLLYSQQCFVIDSRLLRFLQDNGRKLFMITDQDKLIYRIPVAFAVCTKNT